MDRERMKLRLACAVEEAWNVGSPVAAPPFDRVANIAIRRWLSQPRRLPPTAAFPVRVEDLAKGLRDQTGPDPKLVGPLMEDYRYLAGHLALVLDS